MALLRFFKLAKPKSFNYVPVFYDERKEKVKARNVKTERKAGSVKTKDYKPIISRGIMRGYYKKSKKADRYSSLRLILIIALLFAIAYYIIVKIYFK
jgi:hypothetical protein